MKIHFARSGGFAGLRLELSLDTASLDKEDASAMEKLVQEAAFFDLPSGSVHRHTGADKFEYRIRISSSRHSEHVVVVPETAVPASLEPLLTRLCALAREDAGSTTPDRPNGA